MYVCVYIYIYIYTIYIYIYSIWYTYVDILCVYIYIYIYILMLFIHCQFLSICQLFLAYVLISSQLMASQFKRKLFNDPHKIYSGDSYVHKNIQWGQLYPQNVYSYIHNTCSYLTIPETKDRPRCRRGTLELCICLQGIIYVTKVYTLLCIIQHYVYIL